MAGSPAAPELASALAQPSGPAARVVAAPSAPLQAHAAVPATQPSLVGSLARLARNVDGAHELTVALHPADLGSVQVRAVLHRGALSVTIACADDAARHAVAAALPDLHHRLSALDGDSGSGVDLRFADSESGPPGGHEQGPSDPQRRDDDPTGPATHGPQADLPVVPLRSTSAMNRRHLPDDGLDRWM